MSHISKFKVMIYDKDLQAFRLACKEFGGVLDENATSYKQYYGNSKCDMKVTFKGIGHEIGLIKQPNGSYRMECDTYGELGRKIGSNGNRLTDEFATQKATIAGRQRGWAVNREKDAKNKKKIRLVLTKY